MCLKMIVLFFFGIVIVDQFTQLAYAFDRENFVYWPNGTIPFYINPAHFDKEQSLAIRSTLSLFTFKSCLKFYPVMVEPHMNQHVMVLENPLGIRKCTIDTEGHAQEEPHRITLGYECLRTPVIEMVVMKALGFPFEHNRAIRDVYIDVQFENIEPRFIPLFTKEKILPLDLRALPYDVNSVMHFGERDYSKNGHRTILFKNENIQQNKLGLSKIDIRKLEIIYGPECQKRERLIKIDICKRYPAVRRKRDIDLTSVKSLRVNPNITPPSEKNLTEGISANLKEWGIDDEIQNLIEHVHKISALALKSERMKLCNTTTKHYSKTLDIIDDSRTNDITGIVKVVVSHVKGIINQAVSNLTIFCDEANTVEFFERKRCDKDDRCPKTYRSTLPGPVKYSTQHRPRIFQPTKHDGRAIKPQYANLYRSRNDTEDIANTTRNKRDLTSTRDMTNITDSKNLNKIKATVENETDNIDKHIPREANGTKESLRIATKVFNDKKLNFASVRRHFRDNRETSILSKDEPSVRKRDESNRPLRKINKKRWKTSKRIVSRELTNNKVNSDKETDKTMNSDQEQPRDVEGSSDVEEQRPQKNRVTTRKEKKRSRLPETVPLSKANTEFYAERIWPDGIVRYFIKKDTKYNIQDVRARLEEVNNILERKTCVRIEEISEREGWKYTDYLVLDTSPDYVTGRVGGRQNFGCIELFEGGQHRQHAAMMVMAMLGFYFEVSRHDRDKYIRVHNRHVRPDKLHHFEKIRSAATLPLPYDYTSATHPAWQFWRRLGKTGISTVATYKDQDPDGSIMKALGQNEHLLSNLDIMKINSVYGVHCFQNQQRNKKKVKGE